MRPAVHDRIAAASETQTRPKRRFPPLPNDPAILPYSHQSPFLMSSSSSLTFAPELPGAAEESVGRLGFVRRLTANPTVRKGLFSIVDQGIVSVANLATSVIIGRLCTKSELGVYALAMTLVMFARGIQEQLLSVPYIVYANRRKGDALAAYTGSTLVHQCLLTALMLGALAIFAVALAAGWGPADLLPTALVLLGAAPLILLREYLRQASFAQFQQGAAIALDATSSAIQLGGLAVLGWYGWLSVPAVYAVMAVACGISCFGWFLARVQKWKVESRELLADWRVNWTLGKWGLASQLVGTSTPFLIPWWLALLHGESATGVMAACTTLVGLANMFVIGLANFLSPKAAQAFADSGAPGLKHVLRKASLVFGVTLGAFFLATLVAGESLLTFVYGPQYAGTGAIISLLALGMLVNALGITAGNGLWAMERARANFVADTSLLTVTALGGAVLIAPFGVPGAAAAMLLGTVAGTVIRWLTLWRHLAEFESSPAVS